MMTSGVGRQEGGEVRRRHASRTGVSSRTGSSDVGKNEAGQIDVRTRSRQRTIRQEDTDGVVLVHPILYFLYLILDIMSFKKSGGHVQLCSVGLSLEHVNVEIRVEHGIYPGRFHPREKASIIFFLLR